MIRQRKIISLVCIAALLVAFSGCSKDGISKIGKKETSNTTGWAYNDPKWGGFEVAEEIQQITGPGLVYIEGGSFVMGATQQDVLYDWDNIPRRVTVNSFYMDETEVANVDYLEYLYWLGRVFGADYPEVLRKALPDTLVWRDRLAFNEPFVTTYLRHPSYKNYPVVGVSWVQANDYCVWRTDRVN
ncbi:MAG: SUMF1/EgtB/PvdO family nonheme iron enzyme, partial [Bacteroidales bacterium]|nr:SUMF1/EgtB/PvdO family nonheme iron enzyme [Bacteroidales bacterium]